MNEKNPPGVSTTSILSTCWQRRDEPRIAGGSSSPERRILCSARSKVHSTSLKSMTIGLSVMPAISSATLWTSRMLSRTPLEFPPCSKVRMWIGTAEASRSSRWIAEVSDAER